MHDHDEFLWTGLRTRLDRLGRMRPRALRLETVDQAPETRHPQVSFQPLRPALRNHIQAAEPARVS